MALALAALHAWVFVRHASRLGLYVDDWGQLSSVRSASLRALAGTWPLDYRPFEALPWVVLSHLAGPRLVPYYLLLFGLNFLSSLLLFLVVRRLTGLFPVAAACAAIYAVAPSDPSVFWLTTFAYRFGSVFFLLALLLLLSSSSPPGRVRFAASILSAALCLASNELFLGWVAVLAPVAALYGVYGTRRKSLRRSLPFVILTVAYVGYREWLGPRVLHLFDNKTGGLQLTPGHVLGGWARGFLVDLVGGWYTAAQSLLGSPPSITLLATTIAFLILVALAFFGVRRTGGMDANSAGQVDRLRAWHTGARCVGLGLVAILIGYFPLVLTDAVPSIGWTYSRVNAASTWGAALVITSLIWMAAQVARSGRQAAALFAVGTLAVSLLGAIQEEHVAAGFAQAWSAQRHFWHQTLIALHRVRPQSEVVLAAADASDWSQIDSLPPVGFPSAIDLLLGQHGVSGVVMYRQDLDACGLLLRHNVGDPRVMSVGPAGITWLSGSLTVPYARIAVLSYTGPRGGTITTSEATLPRRTICPLRGSPRVLAGPPAAMSIWKQLLGL